MAFRRMLYFISLRCTRRCECNYPIFDISTAEWISASKRSMRSSHSAKSWVSHFLQMKGNVLMVFHLCCEYFFPGVRHPEELSFAKPLESEDLRYNYREKETSKKKSSVATAIADTNTFIAHQPHGNSTHSSTSSLDAKGTSGCTPVVPHSSRSPAHNNSTPISSPVSSCPD